MASVLRAPVTKFQQFRKLILWPLVRPAVGQVTVVWCCWQAATSWCLVGDSPEIAKTVLNEMIFDGADAVGSIKHRQPH